MEKLSVNIIKPITDSNFPVDAESFRSILFKLRFIANQDNVKKEQRSDPSTQHAHIIYANC